MFLRHPVKRRTLWILAFFAISKTFSALPPFFFTRKMLFPTTTQEVSQIVKLTGKHNAPIVGRGAGTGLSGGALARTGGVMIVFARMNRILSLDPQNQRAVVQPGVVNFDLSLAAAPHGLYFAPDPSSQKSCTIGGNVAENAGGPHTLAYGVTTNHVTALEL